MWEVERMHEGYGECGLLMTVRLLKSITLWR